MMSPAARKIALVVPCSDGAATASHFDSPPALFRPIVPRRFRVTFLNIHSSSNPFLPVFSSGGLTLSWSPA